jgi:putative transposase
MEKPRNYFKDTYHHLFNRGVNKELIFYENGDNNYFLKQVRKYKDKYRIIILSYCLMPNHFHLFVKQTNDVLTVGKFVGDLLNSYTKFFNTKYTKSGVLFQGPTKSKMIENKDYFSWLIKYILYNPVKAGLVKAPEEWRYSSAKELLEKKEVNITNYTDVISMFQNETVFREFLIDTKTKFNYEYFRF